MISSARLKITFFLLLLVNLAKGSDDLHKISMKEERLALPGFPYLIDSVLDHRINTYFIGSVQKGIANTRYPADFEKGLRLEIEALVSASFSKGGNKTKLVLIFHSILIDERTGAASEKGLVDLDFSIAKATENGLLLLDKQTIVLSEGGLDVTASHSRRIAKALQQGLENFSKMDSTHYQNMLYRQKEYTADTSILVTKSIKKGIFRTSLDLLYNQPDENTPYFKNIEYSAVHALVKDSSIDKAEIKKIFAFSNGKNIFINSIHYGNEDNKKGYSFGRADWGGAIVLVHDEIKDLDARALGAAFGLVGALLTADATKEIELFLDLRRGTLLPLDEVHLRFALREFPDLLNKFKNQTDKQQADINVRRAFIKAMNKRLETVSTQK